MGSLKAWQIALVAVFVIRLVQSGVWQGTARHRGENLVFGATPMFRVFGYLGALMFSWGVIDQLLSSVHGDARSPYFVLLFTALLLLTAFGWPKTIELRQAEVLQKRALRGPIRISYSDIGSITFDLRTKDTTVYSVTGEMIVHSNVHVERNLFQKAVVQRSGKRLEPLSVSG